MTTSTVEEILPIFEYLIDLYKEDLNLNDAMEWVGDLKIITEKDDEYIDLCNELDKKLKNKDNDVVFCEPEMINETCQFILNSSKKFVSETIDMSLLKQYVNSSNKKRLISVDLLKDIKVTAIDADGNRINSWSAYKWLYVESELRSSEFKYILFNGVWYRLDNSFYKRIQNDFRHICEKDSGYKLNLPNYTKHDLANKTQNSEENYNKRICENDKNRVCLDKCLYHPADSKGKIEICDILDLEKKCFIHVKRYSGSASLSHLFNQALVSSELLLNDAKCLSLIKKKTKLFEKNDIREYGVVLAIIAKNDNQKKFDFPIFSKITLCETYNRLTKNRNIKVDLVWIENKSRS